MMKLFLAVSFSTGLFVAVLAMAANPRPDSIVVPPAKSADERAQTNSLSGGTAMSAAGEPGKDAATRAMVSAESGGSRPAKGADQPSFANSDLQNAIDEDALQEILRIRKGQGDLFQGTLFSELGTSGQDPFADILRQVIRQTRHPKDTTKTTADVKMVSRASAVTEQCKTQYQSWIHQQQQPVGSESSLVAMMRRTARSLDRAANDLGHQQRHEQADRIRRLADQLRLEARSFSSSPAPITYQADRPTVSPK